jgi:hypothetical protein
VLFFFFSFSLLCSDITSAQDENASSYLVSTLIAFLSANYTTIPLRLVALAVHLLSLLRAFSLPALPLLIDFLQNRECEKLRALVCGALVAMGSSGIEALLSVATEGVWRWWGVAGWARMWMMGWLGVCSRVVL